MTKKNLTLALSLATSALFAHDIALFPETHGRSVKVVAKYGHPGDYQAAVMAKMLDWDAYAPDGGQISCLKNTKLAGQDIVADIQAGSTQDGTWVLATRYDNGFYVKTPEGRMISTTKMEYPSATTSTHNFKFAKAVLRITKSGPGFDRAIGHRLELIPKVDPFLLKPGDKLPVEVRFNGKLLAGAGVEIGDGVTAMNEADIPRYRTDADGIAMVPITRIGLQIVAVDYKTPSRYPALAAEDAYTATLTFILNP